MAEKKKKVQKGKQEAAKKVTGAKPKTTTAKINTPKTATAKTNTPKPTAAKKPVKPTEAKKPAATPKATKPAKSPAAKAAAPKKSEAKKLPPKVNKILNSLKHSDEEELTISEERPIIIKKTEKPKKPKLSQFKLKRVTQKGGVTVFDGARLGKTFATMEEATAYAVDVMVRTGEIVEVSRTDRQVTHTFKPQQQQSKKK